MKFLEGVGTHTCIVSSPKPTTLFLNLFSAGSVHDELKQHWVRFKSLSYENDSSEGEQKKVNH